MILHVRCLRQASLAAMVCIAVGLAGCEFKREAGYTYTNSGQNLGASNWHEIPIGESKVSFVGDDPATKREAQSASGSAHPTLGASRSALYPDGSRLDLSPVEAFARQWREEHAGKSFEVDRLGGACLLLKAEVCSKIEWNEASTPFGAIDGDLLSEKVRKAGYRLVCCRDLFVHHFGSRLFAALRVSN